MPKEVPGSRFTQIAGDWIKQAGRGVRSALGFSQQSAQTNLAPGQIALPPQPQPTPGSRAAQSLPNARLATDREPWFGPGTPMAPNAPREDVLGRAFDYPASYNIGTQVRQFEANTFQQLKMLADNCNQVRLAIETVKDQMSGLTWGIKPRMSPQDDLRASPDARCNEIEVFLRAPDKRLPWDAWMRELFEQMLVLDAPCVYIRRTVGGKPYSLEVMDGATIRPVIDPTGRQPMPPQTAYQQILKGMPASNYRADELVYMPRNPRPDRVYGFSPVEQLVFTINIVLRRDAAKLNYYTEGNIPEAMIGVPENWTPDMIARFQVLWDSLTNDQRTRSRAKFVPGKFSFTPTRSDASLMSEVDEWFARLICYCFSLPEQPFVKMQNRATAETANESALEQGMQPRMIWFKAFVDRLIEVAWGYTDIEFVWDDVENIDPQEEAERNLQAVQSGLKSIDEVRAEMGLPKLGMGPAIWGVGPMGLMFIEDLLQARAQGLMMPQPPPPPQQIDPATGQPIPQAAPPPALPAPGGTDPAQAGDPTSGQPPMSEAEIFAGIPANLLAAVGLGPQGHKGRKIDVTGADEFESDPAAKHVAHPNVLRALRGFEMTNKRRARRRA